MAGSYHHCVTDSGKLRENLDLLNMLENGGDVYEAIEEMYGMIWYLAVQLRLVLGDGTRDPAELVERARQQYQLGLQASPGVER